LPLLSRFAVNYVLAKPKKEREKIAYISLSLLDENQWLSLF